MPSSGLRSMHGVAVSCSWATLRPNSGRTPAALRPHSSSTFPCARIPGSRASQDCSAGTQASRMVSGINAADTPNCEDALGWWQAQIVQAAYDSRPVCGGTKSGIKAWRRSCPSVAGTAPAIPGRRACGAIASSRHHFATAALDGKGSGLAQRLLPEDARARAGCRLSLPAPSSARPAAASPGPGCARPPARSARRRGRR